MSDIPPIVYYLMFVGWVIGVLCGFALTQWTDHR